MTREQKQLKRALHAVERDRTYEAKRQSRDRRLARASKALYQAGA